MNSRVARIVPAYNELVDLGNSDTPVWSFNLGHGVVPTVFWGKLIRQGREEILFEDSF